MTVQEFRELADQKLTEEQIYDEINAFILAEYPQYKKLSRFDKDLKYNPKANFRHRKEMARYAKLNTRGYPDFRLDVCVKDADGNILYCGLLLEIKKYGKQIYTKKGDLVADEHIREQAAMHELLREQGFCVDFAVGKKDAIEKIEKYLEVTRPEKETETNSKE